MVLSDSLAHLVQYIQIAIEYILYTRLFCRKKVLLAWLALGWYLRMWRVNSFLQWYKTSAKTKTKKAHSPQTICTVCFYTKYPLFFFSVSVEFCYWLDRECLCNLLPVSTWSNEYPMSFPGWQQLACVITVPWGKGEKFVLCDSTQREDSWTLMPGFLWSLPHAPFPFADLALCHISL